MVEGCNKWKKLGEKLKRHSESETCKESTEIWGAYKQTNISGTVADQLVCERASVVPPKLQVHGVTYKSSHVVCMSVYPIERI